MYLSRIRVENFRNFRELDVELGGNVVIVGENRVGKSNLLFALRLIFDPSFPDSSRQLGLADFWDELDDIDIDTAITVSVEISDFEDDLDVLAVLTDYRLDDDPDIVRLTYRLCARPGLEGAPASDDDFVFVCFGGESEAKRFGHELRRRITMDVLPALRDAEGDLAAWRRSPLRPLVENAFAGIDHAELEVISEKIAEATDAVTEFEEMTTLQTRIAELFLAMSGVKQDVQPSLGFSATDATRINRQVRLLIDEGRRSIADASLGSANLIFLTLKLLDLQRLIASNKRDHSLLAIEEPEAHLHPHLQRLVYKHLFETIVAGGDDDDGAGEAEEASPLSVILTTHSPHIVSVAPLASLLLLRAEVGAGTKGYSTAVATFTEAEAEDLGRYLDVTRAEMVFARGVLLVEGDAERFLIPVFAAEMDISLDEHGISVCSIGGTNFQPYVKLLCALGIPFAVVTDYDEVDGVPRAYNRARKLVSIIDEARGGDDTKALVQSISEMETYDESFAACEDFGIFVNSDTLETELFRGDFAVEMVEALREHKFGKERRDLLDAWEADAGSVDNDILLQMIEQMGKGRFAQRLATRVAGKQVPDYIAGAISMWSTVSDFALYLRAAEDLRRNDEQWQAYESTGHCVLLAGPGSGKTKTLSVKLARILSEDVEEPRGVACITYNNECARELETRLDGLGIETSGRVFVGTVHSFSLTQIILPYAKAADLELPDEFTVATQQQARGALERAFATVIGGPENPQNWRLPMDRYRRNFLDRAQPIWRGADPTLCELVEAYEAELRMLNLIDFDDMPLLAVRALAQNRWLQKALVAKFPVLAVDEYQDLGRALHHMVMGLCFGAGMRLFAVGDVDQSIYGFTGAHPELLRRLSERDDVETVRLGLNYRCGSRIVAASEYALGEERGYRAPDNAHEGTIYFHPCSDGYAGQARYLIEELIPEIRQRRPNLNLGEIAIVYPAAFLGDEVADAAAAGGYPIIRTDGNALYPRGSRLLRWLEQCAMWCCGGWRTGRPRLERIFSEGSRLFHEAMTGEEDRLHFRRDLIELLWERREERASLHDWLVALRSDIVEPRTSRARSLDDERAMLDGLIARLGPAGDVEDSPLAEFAGIGAGRDRINLSTLHSAKGREFDVVIMFGMEEGRVPRNNALEREVREARRLFYVGFTRARHEIHLMFEKTNPSRFVNEVWAHLAAS